MRVPIFLSLITAALLGGAGQVMFKLGADGRTSLSAFVNVWIAAGLLSYGLGTLLWIFSLSKAPLTLVYPFTALSFVFVYAAGVLLLKEATSPKAVIGVGLVLLGLYLVQSSK